MAREKPLFRDNLERLDQIFPSRELLRKKEVADFLGIDVRTATRRFSFTKNYISKVKLASELS